MEQLERRYEQSEQQYRQASRRLRVQAGLALCAVIGAIVISPANRSAIAQGYGVTLASLDKRVTILENRMTGVETKNTQQDTTLASLQTQINSTPAGPQGPQGDKGDQGIQGPAGTPADMTRVVTLETKTQYMSVDTTAKSVTFSGCNLLVNNGLGATNGNPANPLSIDTTNTTTVNGLGNLIVGYNESRDSLNFGGPDNRTGSHNLIVGYAINYSSFGGIGAGTFNTISGPLASITGGYLNTASGAASSVSGGNQNTASGYLASVSGGANNTASGDYTSVGGGRFNTASGLNSSVSGGLSNTASGIRASVSGGNGNTQNNVNGWSGGTFHSP